MIKGDYDRLKDLASRNSCSEHQTPLEVAWYGPEKTWVLRCGHDHYPDAITRQLSLTEGYLAGEELPEPIKSNVIKGMRRKQMQEGKSTEKDRTWLVPKVDLATGELLPIDRVTALMDYAVSYGLDPYRGHVVVMYSKPYITIDGYLYHAKRTNTPYSLVSRPLNEDEEKTYKVGAQDHAWLAEVILGDEKGTFTGMGVVTHEEMIATAKGKPEQLRSPVVAAHPWQLAQKRAEWQALRRAFPIGETQEVESNARNKDQSTYTVEH